MSAGPVPRTNFVLSVVGGQPCTNRVRAAALSRPPVPWASGELGKRFAAPRENRGRCAAVHFRLPCFRAVASNRPTLRSAGFAWISPRGFTRSTESLVPLGLFDPLGSFGFSGRQVRSDSSAIGFFRFAGFVRFTPLPGFVRSSDSGTRCVRSLRWSVRAAGSIRSAGFVCNLELLGSFGTRACRRTANEWALTDVPGRARHRPTR
jgi:hypothetical protein